MKNLFANPQVQELLGKNQSSFLEGLLIQFYNFLPGLIGAVFILIVGWKLITFFNKRVQKSLSKSDYDVALQSFLGSVIGITLKIALLISVASMVGVKTTSFLAILGSAGLAVGLALQGSLSNFAGGVMLLIFKPFKVGDYIEAHGHQGTVKGLSIFHTTMNTVDNKRIVLPNGPLANTPIINFSTEEIRRVDFLFGIGYSDDVVTAKNYLYELIREDQRVIQDPAPLVAVHQFGDNSVNLTVRAWTKAPDYWGFYWDTMEKVKLGFDEQGFSIPFPQRDVHLYQKNS